MIPRFTRARGRYLYDKTGRRYLDLHADDGRAILGHRPGTLTRHIKNSFEKGLLVSYPSRFTDSVLRAAQRVFPEYRYAAVYPTMPDALDAIAATRGRPVSYDDLSDPARDLACDPARDLACATARDLACDPARDLACDPARDLACVWIIRPFLERPARAEIALPLLPFPGAFAPQLVVSQTELPVGDNAPPPFLAGLRHSLSVFATLAPIEIEWPAVKTVFRQQGPYLCPVCSSEAYAAVFTRCLESGILINPRYPRPSCAASEATRAERDAYAAAVSGQKKGPNTTGEER